jgi:hypothetical protein
LGFSDSGKPGQTRFLPFGFGVLKEAAAAKASQSRFSALPEAVVVLKVLVLRFGMSYCETNLVGGFVFEKSSPLRTSTSISNFS